MKIDSLEVLNQLEDRTKVTAVRVVSSDQPLWMDLLLECPQLQKLEWYRLDWVRTAQLNLYKITARLPQLQEWEVNGGEVPAIDSRVRHLVNLKRLTIKNIYYGKFPDKIFLLNQLEELDFSNSKLQKIVLDKLYLFSELKYLNFYGTGLRHFPEDILELKKLQALILPPMAYTQLKKVAPQLIDQIPYVYTNDPIEKKCIVGVVNYVRKQQLSWQKRLTYFNLLAHNSTKLQQLATPQMILEATDVPRQEMLRLHALEYYQVQYGLKDLSLLKQEKANLTIVGKLGSNKNELKQKLKELGIKYSTKITAKTTALLLGQSSKGIYIEALQQQIPILTEKVLIDFLDDNLELYLLEDQAAEADLVAQVSDLLQSNDESNHLLALTLFKQGGFPKELLTDICIIFLQSENRTVKRACERIIRQYGSVHTTYICKEKYPIFDQRQSERRCANKLKQIAKHTELDTIKIAKWGVRHFGLGKLYLLQTLKGAARVDYLKELCEGTRLRLQNLHLKRPMKEIFMLDFLTELDLQYNYLIAELPTAIQQLKNLKVLNLNYCLIATEPDKIAALQELLPNVTISAASPHE